MSRKVFAELRRDAPGKVAYALLRDGDAFVHLFVNTAQDDADAILELPASMPTWPVSAIAAWPRPSRIGASMQLIEQLRACGTLSAALLAQQRQGLGALLVVDQAAVDPGWIDREIGQCGGHDRLAPRKT